MGWYVAGVIVGVRTPILEGVIAIDTVVIDVGVGIIHVCTLQQQRGNGGVCLWSKREFFLCRRRMKSLGSKFNGRLAYVSTAGSRVRRGSSRDVIPGENTEDVDDGSRNHDLLTCRPEIQLHDTTRIGPVLQLIQQLPGKLEVGFIANNTYHRFQCLEFW